MSQTVSYDDDVFLWSQEQARLIRALKARQRDLPNALDLDNIAEEIESVGRSDLHAVQSLLVQVFAHLIKLADRGLGHGSAEHWSAEILAFQRQIRRRCTPGMRQHIDLQAHWEDARADAAQLADLAGAPEPASGETCPFPLDNMLEPAFSIRAAVDRIRPPA